MIVGCRDCGIDTEILSVDILIDDDSSPYKLIWLLIDSESCHGDLWKVDACNETLKHPFNSDYQSGLVVERQLKEILLKYPNTEDRIIEEYRNYLDVQRLLD